MSTAFGSLSALESANWQVVKIPVASRPRGLGQRNLDMGQMPDGLELPGMIDHVLGHFLVRCGATLQNRNCWMQLE